MGSQTSPPPTLSSLPTIDFSNPELKPGSPNWELVKSQVREAMGEYGCFCAVFMDSEDCPDRHGFRTEVFPLLKSLFDVPQERKSGISPPCSYIPRRPDSGSPAYESLAIGDASTFEALESFVNGLLPQGDLCSSKALESFKKEALRLQETIRRMIGESLGAEKYLEDHISSVQYSLRMQKYEGSTKSGAEVGLLPHRDPNTLTILYQNQVSGLEVQTKEGNWVAVTPQPSSFIVMMAESLNDGESSWQDGKVKVCTNFGSMCFVRDEAWANWRFHVPPHRVVIGGSEDRYSIGLFTRPKDGYTVQVPQELVDEQHPLLYGPFIYSEYKKAQTDYLSSGKGLLSLKAYCDIQCSSVNVV